MLVWLPIAAWAPAAAAMPSYWPSLPLGSLRALLTGHESQPQVPHQAWGRATGLHHQVPPWVTRANRGHGLPPGKGRGQLPPYHPHAILAHRHRTGYTGRAGFGQSTSRLLPDATTAHSRMYQNADGSRTIRIYPGPVNYRTATGSYQPIDTTLVTGPGGHWQEKGNSVRVSFAGRANAPSLGSFAPAAGESYSFGLAGASSVAGAVTGATVTYPGALPGTDLTESGTAQGFSQSLVLHDPGAATSWIFPLHLHGLSPVLDRNGSVSLVNASGRVAAVIPAGQATDARMNRRSGLPVSTHRTTWRLVTYHGGLALRLSLSPTWLHDPSRSFPVKIDATGNEGVTGTTYVQTGNVNVNNSQANLMHMGTYDGGTDKARTFMAFGNLGDVGNKDLRDYHITAANLHVFDAWAWTCSSPERFDVNDITQSWSLTSMSWPGPSTGSNLGWSSVDAPSAACGNSSPPNPSVGGWMTVSLSTDVLNSWTLGTEQNHGLELQANNESDNNQWKQLDGYNSPNPPYMELTYTPDVAPQINSTYPQNNYNASSLTPELLANGSDADNWPDPLTYQFVVLDAKGNKIATSTPGGYNNTGDEWTSSPDWTVPEGALSWGQPYAWYVQDFDGLEFGTSPVSYFTTQVPQPTIGSSAQNGGAQGISPGSDTYTTSVTDAQVSTVGPSLSIERDYDSGDLNSSRAFGTGWSSILGMRVAPGLTDASGNTDTVVVTYPDGEQVGFGENPGKSPPTFTAPQGRYAQLAVVTSGGYTLTDKNDTVYSFTEPLGGSAYGISSITDALGNTLTFGWNTASPPQITSMTSASGRSLAINWSTPSGASYPHVATVTTNDVIAGNAGSALTWSYAYSGDDLTGVCSPANGSSCAGASACPSGSTGCTAYTYTSGTGYPGAVLNTGPHSYWRFDESSGTTATSSVLANEGSDNATYNGVTLGQPGPLAGSTATAASFNGTSSSPAYVQMPTDLVSGASYQSLSMWFKTTTGGGVLFSSSKDPVTQSTTPGNYTPNLYLGTGGELHGEFWNNAVNPIVSSSSVADGNWHQVVLTASGNTQAMYLDGQPVGTMSGTVNNAGLNNDYTGAGFLGGGWPNEPHQNQNGNTGYQTFFNGNISDVGFWDRPLSPTEVAGLYQAGHSAASPLSQVTRPSGNVYAQVSYSAVSGAVTQVTDDNGGTWKLKTPAVTGSSLIYAASVLGAGPVDYWRLDDTGTSTAVNQVNGGTATYSNVTQGVSGPFSDSTADQFNGSSSNIELPSGMVTGQGNQSVSLWFKTTSNSEIILGSSADPLSAGTTGGNYVPELYVGKGGDLNAEFWNGQAEPFVSSSTVNDGEWHNVVLAAGTSGQTVYLDGQQLGTLSGTISGAGQPNVYVGAGFIGGTWPDEPHQGSPNNTGYATYFNGSIGEVAFYDSQLSQAQVTAEYQASQSTSGLTPVESQWVNDPSGRTILYLMDPLNGNRVISQTDALGNITNYGYDSSGFPYSVVDPNGNETITGHDIRGNLVSQTTCQDQTKNECSTGYYTYYPDDTNTNPTPDPRNDLPLTGAGPGSASATDPTYLTTYSYNSSGELQSETGPPVPGFPSGRTTSHTYTTSSTTAYNAQGQPSGTTPPGLPATSTTPGGAVTGVEYYSDGDVYQVTDPDGMTTTYTYDGLGRVLTKTVTSNSYPNGLTTTYTYDAMGDVATETDPPVTDAVTGAVHTAKITTVYDGDGDVKQQTVADLTGGDASRIMANTYNSYDQLASSTDPVGATTQYTYDKYGNLATQTDAAGNLTRYAYDPDGDLLTTTLDKYTGSPSGSQPPAPLTESTRTYDPGGRLATVTNAMGFTTHYTYTGDGLLATVQRCGGWNGNSCTGSVYIVQSNTYNAAGQLTTQVTNNGQTTTNYTPDAAGQNTSQTVDPQGLDRVTTYSYSPDDMVLNQSVHTGSNAPVKSTDYTYDPMGNTASRSVHDDNQALTPSGWWPLNDGSGAPSGYTPMAASDASGSGNTGYLSSQGVSWTPSSGAATFNGTSNEGINTAGPVVNTSGSFSVSAWAKLVTPGSYSEGIVSEHSTNEDGFRLQYDGASGDWSFNRTTADTATSPTLVSAESGTSAQPGTWTMVTGVFNASSGLLTLYVNGTKSANTATDSTPFAATGPLAIGNDEWAGANTNWLNGSVSNVQVYPYALSDTQVSTLYGYGRTGGALGENRLTTNWTLDQRGLPSSMTDPNANTTQYTYDAAGQLTSTTSAPIPVATYGGQPSLTVSETRTGYNTFGDAVEAEDPDGNVTLTTYDADSRPTSVIKPSYTPPDGSGTIAAATTTTAYNLLGEPISQTDPLGNTTTYAYDQLHDVTSMTAPDGGVTSYSYDPNGDQLSVTGPTGAVTNATYDYMGRKLTSTQVERYPAPASCEQPTSPPPCSPVNYTTTYSYGANDTSPWLTSQKSPDAVVTTYGHDAAGETTSTEDGAQNTTGYSYDAAGRPVTTTYPDGTYTTTSYDEAGRAVGQTDHTAGGSVVRSDSAIYDGNGNQVSATDYRGNTTTFSYNAVNWLTNEVQPVSSTSSVSTAFSYDAAGNQTLYVDGNGNDWWKTYNSWNLPESKIEPPTPAYPTAAQGTFTTSYNADGNPRTETEPGGVSVTGTYNKMQELTSQAGTGAQASTITRSFGYDQNGNLTSASAPGGTDTFTYDDRNLLTSATGPSGASQFVYNGDALPSSVGDAAGTTSYTYNNNDQVQTLGDAATGNTLSYTYNSNDQVSTISYGSNNDTRTFGYNNLHELTSDKLTGASGQVAAITYQYDPNGNLTTKTASGFAGSTSNTYTYDEANRLATWNNGTTTTNYGYDANGNRTQVGSATYHYDARDELTSDGTNTYSYTANGTLSTVSGPAGTVNYTVDAFAQTITEGGQTYAYDAMGRVVSDTGSGPAANFSYSGLGSTLASDGTHTYTWDPTGTTLVGTGTVGGSQSTGVLALTDQHNDVVGQFTAAGLALSGSATYDPLGNVVAAAGMTGNLGYQSGWTDPANGRVNMLARWYDPQVGQFTSRDTVDVNPVPNSAAANPFAYVADNPLDGTDPSGHMLNYGGASLDGTAPSGGDGNQTPPTSSCSWWTGSCFVQTAEHVVSNAYHLGVNFYHAAVRIAVSAYGDVSALVDQTIRYLHEAISAAAREAGHLAHELAAGIADAAQRGIHVLGQVWHAAQSATAGVAHAVTHWAVQQYQAAVNVIHTAVHDVAHAVTVTANFVKAHAAAIASMVVSTVVFVGCDAALGIPTGGVGAVAGAAACGTLAGAVGSSVSYGITAAQTGKFSWSGLAESAVSGAAAGALAGGLGAGLGAVIDAASGLLADGAATDAATAATDGAAGGAAADGAAATADTADAAAQDPVTEQTSPAGTAAEQNPALCGGMSFTAGTKVLTARGALVAISKLHAGEKVKATNTRTGKTTSQTVTAVLVHHDTNLYDLKIQAGTHTAVIDTTRTHLFWDQDSHRWIKAAALKHGTHLRTSPTGGRATVIGGYSPHDTTGWMWDLTIQDDHDFYIQAATTTILVHNCPAGNPSEGLSRAQAEAARSAASRDAGNAARDVIAEMYPGSRIEVPFDTELGTRIVDVLTPDNIAIESKVGYTTVGQRIGTQIAKDQLLMQNGRVSGVKWIFSPGMYGQVGPSKPLANALEAAGIQWEIMQP